MEPKVRWAEVGGWEKARWVEGRGVGGGKKGRWKEMWAGSKGSGWGEKWVRGRKVGRKKRGVERVGGWSKVEWAEQG